jgi:hypothetical protein
MEFAKAVQRLVDEGVEFVVIGGLSAAFHGSARLTFDLDICYARSLSNLRRMVASLAPFHPRPRGFPSDLPFLWDERTLQNGTVFTLDTDLGPIDLLAEVAGVGAYDQAKEHSVMVEAFDRRVATLDLAALIRSKRAAGRERDLSALPELESLLEAEEPE